MTRILGFEVNPDTPGISARDVPDQLVGAPIQEPTR